MIKLYSHREENDCSTLLQLSDRSRCAVVEYAVQTQHGEH